jgi:hypothetical protein
MMREARPAVFGVSSVSTAQTCPPRGLAWIDGQWISASAMWAVPMLAGRAARMRRSPRHHARPVR